MLMKKNDSAVRMPECKHSTWEKEEERNTHNKTLIHFPFLRLFFKKCSRDSACFWISNDSQPSPSLAGILKGLNSPNLKQN